MESFHCAQDWLTSLYSEARFFQKKSIPSLESINTYLDLLGRPDRSFKYRIIVGGTAGKGTVCRRTEQGLLDTGYSVLTLISPHIQVVTERIRINGGLIDPSFFASAVLQIKDLYEKHKVPLTYYEAVVLTGILAGEEQGIDIIVAEVGMGGEWDAVNALQGKRISALTFVGEDHLDILGPTVQDIAITKSGIFTKETVFGLTYEQKYYSIIQKKAPIKIQLIKGIKSKLNKKIAQKICKYISEKEFVMQPLKLPARWEKISVDSGLKKLSQTSIILDGAHSNPRFEFLEKKLKQLPRPSVGILAMTENHDSGAFKYLLDYLDEIIWTSSLEQRVFQHPLELQKKFKRGEIVKDPNEALDLALEKAPASILVTGSFYLCGEVRERFYSSEDIIDQQTEFPKRSK